MVAGDALWVSDGPATARLWRSGRDEDPRSGRWPLLLASLAGEPRRPWDDGELRPAPVLPGGPDAQEVLIAWWDEHTDAGDEDDPEIQDADLDGTPWPGLAPPSAVRIDPDE